MTKRRSTTCQTKNWLCSSTAVFLALALTASSALAQDKGGPKIAPHCLKIFGAADCQPGFWFPADRAKQALNLSYQHHALMLKCNHLEGIAKTRREQIMRMRQLVDAQQAAVIEAGQRAKAAKVLVEEADAHRRAWWRNHWGWFAVGLVVGGISTGYVATQ